MGWALPVIADYKAARLDPQDVEQVLNAIERTVLVSEYLVRDVAEKHLSAFRTDMFERFGAEDLLPSEPYLETEIARFQLQFLQTMTRLTEQLERKLLSGAQAPRRLRASMALVVADVPPFPYYSSPRARPGGRASLERASCDLQEANRGSRHINYEDKSGIDPKFPLTPQVEERIAWATRGLRERMERALDEKRQRASGIEKYVWHTMDDDRVRPSHTANDGLTFRWDLKPATGHPGEDFGCRCWAEPVVEGGKLPDDPPLESVYPELFLLPALAGTLRAITAAARGLYTLTGEIRKLVSRPEPKPRELEKPTAPSEKPGDILNPNGKPIGKPGKRSDVRVGEGGKKAAEKIFERLSKGGQPEQRPRYSGKGVRLPNGDWVGYRSTSKSGPPTIDLDVEGIPYNKIKFPE